MKKKKQELVSNLSALSLPPLCVFDTFPTTIKIQTKVYKNNSIHSFKWENIEINTKSGQQQTLLEKNTTMKQ